MTADNNSAKASPYPFCVDCRWLANEEQKAAAIEGELFRHRGPLRPGGDRIEYVRKSLASWHWCGLPSPIDGSLSSNTVPCQDRRSEKGYCGLEGRLFEPKLSAGDDQ
jgi:hypothetical protein